MDTSTAVAILVALDAFTEDDDEPRQKRKWMKQWHKDHEKFGHVNLLNELRLSEKSDFRNFLRMDEAGGKRIESQVEKKSSGKKVKKEEKKTEKSQVMKKKGGKKVK